jgi:hypothetical protein
VKEIHILITIALVVLQFTLPRKWAFLPLLIAALHTSHVSIIPSFSTARIVVIAGLFRSVAAGDFRWNSRNPIDFLILCFGAIALTTSLFHQPTVSLSNPSISRLRLIIDVVGTFLYAKAFITSTKDLKLLAKATAYIAVPLALGMIHTKLTLENIYALVGGNPYPMTRNGTLRGSGPFGTPILAGTVGALIIPFFILAWREHRTASQTGIVAALAIIYCSGSSTPIGALLIGVTSISLWKFRNHIRLIITTSIIILILMALVKTRPIWYLIAITDFVGGSTGWHRAYLIDMAIQHIDEWWLYGTEYTRHWMPYGLSAVPEHCDLTNYYIHMAVFGGFPLMLTIILIFRFCFRIIQIPLHHFRKLRNQDEFTIWCIGALLFTHAITCLTISYFDNSYILFYFVVAFISNLHSPSSFISPDELESN